MRGLTASKPTCPETSPETFVKIKSPVPGVHAKVAAELVVVSAELVNAHWYSNVWLFAIKPERASKLANARSFFIFDLDSVGWVESSSFGKAMN
jgi:hypothetical protein